MIQGVYQGVTTEELDTLAAETSASFTTRHPDYAILAARISVSNLHKQTKKVFTGEWALGSVCKRVLCPSSLSHRVLIFSRRVDVMTDLHDYINPKTGKPAPLISEECYAVMMKHKDVRCLPCFYCLSMVGGRTGHSVSLAFSVTLGRGVGAQLCHHLRS